MFCILLFSCIKYYIVLYDLIFYQILFTNILRKCMEISLIVDIGLKKDLSDTHVQIRQSIGLLFFRSLHPKEKELN